MKRTTYHEAKPVEQLPGITRRTLAYNDDVMLCHFELKKGAVIPLHSHAPSQIGYVAKGRAKFLAENDADSYERGEGEAYVIDPNVTHGAEALEDTVFIECFNPMRPEYADF